MRLGRRGRLSRDLLDVELDLALMAGRIAHRSANQTDEMALDPVAREVVRNGEHELVVIELEALHVVEPRAVRRLVEGASEPTRNLAPKTFCSQLN